MPIARQLAAAFKALLVLTVLTGVLYPMAITAAGRLAPGRADGSLIRVYGRVVGSSLLGQAAAGAQWFSARPSASDQSGETSGGSNLGAAAPDLSALVREREAALRAANPDAPGPVPADALTASASGLDPDISPDYARWQAPRVAAARGLPVEVVLRVIAVHTRGPVLGFIGTHRVDVTELNADLARSPVTSPGR